MHIKDEMERTITNKAMKVSWTITIICLFLTGGYQFVKYNQEMNILLIIGIISVISLITAEQYYSAKTNEDKSFKNFSIIAAVIFILLIITLFFVTGL